MLSERWIAFLSGQGLAAGLMLCISMVDLLPASVESIGFVQASLCFYAGILFFAVVTAVVPEPDLEHMICGEVEDSEDDKQCAQT